MATRFEFVLHGPDPIRLQAAAEEALDEIDRLEARLSLFRPSSEIAHLNARAAYEPVRVSPSVFALLQHANKLHQESLGAFDITVAPLVRCWGFMGGSGEMPKPEDVAQARATVGMDLVELEPDEFTVRFSKEGVMLDLGAVGKGYAIECAAEILRDAGVASALLHGGTSTVYALGHPPDADSWQVALETPASKLPGGRTMGKASGTDSPTGSASLPQLPIIALKDEALSVSAVWGKSFESEGKILGHVIDPRTGAPAASALLAAVVLPSATETDALSTALLTLGTEGHNMIASLRPGMRTVLVTPAQGGYAVETRNFPER
jgi:thiamine biosynthesis lipoprotein